jgi:hypothetical protein
MIERHTNYPDEFIEKGIKEVVTALNIKRMPTRTEILTVTKNTKLDNAIQRSYKYSGWAEKLDLKLKESETTLGKEYENIAVIDILQHTGMDSEKMSQNYPFDLLVANNIRVDVKTANRYYYKDSAYFYSFNLEKRHPVCDLFVCYCINDKNEVDKTFIIPSSKLHLTQLSIGTKSRYDIYLNAWDCFQKYYDFYNSLII